MIDTVIFSTEASGTFNYTPLPYLFSSHISRIQMGEQQNFPTSGRRAKWSISYVFYSQKISEPLAKFQSGSIVSNLYVKDKRTRREQIWTHNSILHFRLYMGNVLSSTAPMSLCEKGHSLPKGRKSSTVCQHLQEPPLPRTDCAM